MGYFQVRYDSRVVNYDRRGFIGFATGAPSFSVKLVFGKWTKKRPELSFDWSILFLANSQN